MIEQDKKQQENACFSRILLESWEEYANNRSSWIRRGGPDGIKWEILVYTNKDNGNDNKQ